MSFEHLRVWLCAATREEDPDLVNIQAAFRVGELVATCAWKTVVMIPNGGGTNFRGVNLVEVLWKATSTIINRRLLSSI